MDAAKAWLACPQIERLFEGDCCIWIPYVAVAAVIVENLVLAIMLPSVAHFGPKLPDRSIYLWILYLVGVMLSACATGFIFPGAGLANFGGLGAMAVFFSYYYGQASLSVAIFGMAVLVAIAKTTGGLSTTFMAVAALFYIALAQASELLISSKKPMLYFHAGALPMAAVFGFALHHGGVVVSVGAACTCSACSWGLLALLVGLAQAHSLPVGALAKRAVRGGEAALSTHPVVLALLSLALTLLGALLQGAFGYLAVLGAGLAALLLLAQDMRGGLLGPAHRGAELGAAWLLTALLLSSALLLLTPGAEAAAAARVLLALGTGAGLLLLGLLLLLCIIECWEPVGSNQWRGLCFDAVLFLAIIFCTSGFVAQHYWAEVIAPALAGTAALLVELQAHVPGAQAAAAAAAAGASGNWAVCCAALLLWSLVGAGLRVLPCLSLGPLHFWSSAHTRGWANTKKAALVFECANVKAASRLQTALRKMQVPATLLVTAGFAREQPALLKGLLQTVAGAELGVLACDERMRAPHPAAGPAALRALLADAVEAVEQATGARARWFAVPHEAAGAWAARAGASLGLRLLAPSARLPADAWLRAEDEDALADALLAQVGGGGDTLLFPAGSKECGADGAFGGAMARCIKVADMVAGELLEKGVAFCSLSEVCKDAPSFADGPDLPGRDGGWAAVSHRLHPSKKAEAAEGDETMGAEEDTTPPPQ